MTSSSSSSAINGGNKVVILLGISTSLVEESDQKYGLTATLKTMVI